MCWVCTNCSTSNEDSESCCAVCGAERLTRDEITERESEELKVVFSGFDAFKEEYCDMLKAGIVDPAKVTRSALQNAASVVCGIKTCKGKEAEEGKKNFDWLAICHSVA